MLVVCFGVNDLRGGFQRSDATPPMYPSLQMGRMHEQEMKSLNLVVGNGIRKHWPFIGSFRPWCESHDSQIFTVPPVSGLVKSQHTSLKPSRPRAGLQQHRRMQRCFFFSFFSLSFLQPWITPRNTRAWRDMRTWGRISYCSFENIGTIKLVREWGKQKEMHTVCRTNGFQASLSCEWASGGFYSPDAYMKCTTNKNCTSAA